MKSDENHEIKRDDWSDIDGDCEELFTDFSDDMKSVLIAKLRETLQQTSRKCSFYRRKLSQNNLERIFGEDQLEYLRTGSSQGVSWSEETLRKGLKLYMACGASGYEEILRQGLPYPSIRTLKSHMRTFQFKSGWLEVLAGCGLNFM